MKAFLIASEILWQRRLAETSFASSFPSSFPHSLASSFPHSLASSFP
ncbi:hypothetical protein FHG87_025742, partial [Trinorchestia longiramus]